MPIIHVHIIKGRTDEQKTAMAKKVTEAVSESLSAPTESIRVLVHECEADDWYVGGEPKSGKR